MTQVLLADDHQLLRQALRRLLPARVLDLIYRAMTWLGLRGEVRLEETGRASCRERV